MTQDPSWFTQKAIYERLTSVLGSSVSVVDNVEAAEYEDTLPFILIGDDALLDNENQISDDYSLRAFIRCHAAGPSRKAAKQLAHQVRTAMAPDIDAGRPEISVEHFQSTSRHAGTQSVLIEGVAHVVVVEWAFDLLEDTE